MAWTTPANSTAGATLNSTFWNAQVKANMDAIIAYLGQANSGPFNLGTPTELTIASSAITVTRSYHTVDTESDAATDNLSTISGGSEGQWLVIRPVNAARTVVAKDAVGNLQLAGDHTMDNSQDTLTLIYDGSNWLEVARSNNGA